MPSLAVSTHSPFSRASASVGLAPPRCSLGLTPCSRSSSPAIGFLLAVALRDTTGLPARGPRKRGSRALLRQPVAELLADVVQRVADVLERIAHALAVVALGRLGLLAQRRLLAAAQVRAVRDAVVVAAAHPGEELVRAAHGHRVGDVELHEQARQPLEPGALLVVVEALLHERVEVELLDR